MKLGKKRRQSSKRNYYIISPRVVIKSDDRAEKYNILRCIIFDRQVSNRCSSNDGGLNYRHRTRAARTLRLDGASAKEFVVSEVRDFCRKHNITLQLVPAYNHRTLSKRGTCSGHPKRLMTVFERMQPVGVSNNRRVIAVPFGCKVIFQIPRESSLCTDGSQCRWQLKASTQEQTTPLPQFMSIFFKNNKTELCADCKIFPDDFPFHDPDMLFDKSMF